MYKVQVSVIIVTYIFMHTNYHIKGIFTCPAENFIDLALNLYSYLNLLNHQHFVKMFDSECDLYFKYLGIGNIDK